MTTNNIRYLCPECDKEYKKHGKCYETHCIISHGKHLDPIEKELVIIHTIEDLYTEIKEIKHIIQNTSQLQITHDIDIKRLHPPTMKKLESEKFRTSEFVNGYKECMNELSSVLEKRREELDNLCL